ncbi:MAG: hypothetical protein HQK77_00835 [Desulfobacterales bacterium]|nr:hypothetical protein [Desulfobacterales bacterium]
MGHEMEALKDFSAFTGAARVQYDSMNDEVKASSSQPSSALGKLWNWLTRSNSEVKANKETVREFVSRVKDAYPDVGDMATAGLASHLDKGKPLTGRRIHEVIDLAEQLKAKSLPPQKQTEHVEQVEVKTETKIEPKPKLQQKPPMERDVQLSLGHGAIFYFDAELNARSNKMDVSSLNKGELASIYSYTTSQTRIGFNFMNSALRNPEDTNYDYLRPAIKAAATGMEKLPDFTDKGGLCYRTVKPGPFLDQYQKGSVVTELAFTSTHKWEHAEKKGDNPENMRQPVLIIEGRHGKDVSGLSAFKDEEEVLYKPLTKFEVTDRFTNQSGFLVIKMREVE